VVLGDSIFCGGFDSDGAGLASHRMAADVEEFWSMYRWRWGVIQRSFVPPRQFWWTRQKFPCEVSGSPSRVFGLVYSDPLVGLLFVVWGWMVRQLASDPGNDEEMTACLWPVHSTNQ
jgi:hypothetical protein